MDTSSREASYVDVLLVKPRGGEDFAYEGLQAFIARSDLPPQFSQDPFRAQISASYTGCGSPSHLKRLKAGAGGLHDLSLPFTVQNSSCFFQAGCPPPPTNTALWSYVNSRAGSDPYTNFIGNQGVGGSPPTAGLDPDVAFVEVSTSAVTTGGFVRGIVRMTPARNTQTQVQELDAMTDSDANTPCTGAHTAQPRVARWIYVDAHRDSTDSRHHMYGWIPIYANQPSTGRTDCP